MKPELHTTTNILLEAIVSRPKGSYIFSGPSGIGKHTAARWLAMRLHCPDPDPNCLTCRQVAENNHPSVSVIAPDTKASIGIAQIQQLQHDLSLRQYDDQTHRLIIIDQAQLLTREAQNCLLKTIEEPPQQTILILLTNTPDVLLPTIRSRCNLVNFSRLPDANVKTFLESSYSLPEERQETIIKLAEGSIGFANTLATDDELYSQYRELLAELEGVPSLSTFERLLLAAKLTEGRGNPSLLPQVARAILRRSIRLAPESDLLLLSQKITSLVNYESWRASNVNLKSALSGLLLAL